jgi:Flp pilus assembly protein TadG
MKKLDQRGVAALEFCLVAVPLFTLMFVIFDLGRYAITMQSLRSLANAGARAIMINNCYVNAALQKTSPTCSGDPLPSDAAKQAVAPFLYNNGSPAPPTLNVPATTTSPLIVTASQNFTMIMPIWGTALNAPSASTSVPF